MLLTGWRGTGEAVTTSEQASEIIGDDERR
jgi:hypothetical protein